MSRSKHRAYTTWDRHVAFFRIAIGEFGPQAQAYVLMPFVFHFLAVLSRGETHD